MSFLSPQKIGQKTFYGSKLLKFLPPLMLLNGMSRASGSPYKPPRKKHPRSAKKNAISFRADFAVMILHGFPVHAANLFIYAQAAPCA